MIGAIIGDIAGSKFEFSNNKNKNFEIFSEGSFFTDDTVMTLAVAEAIKNCGGDYKNLSAEAMRQMQRIGQKYPDCGYGNRFYHWIFSEFPPYAYGSCGNGAAMRVSACGFFARSLDEAKSLSKKVTEISHSHPQGIIGAEAVAVCIYLAKTGKSKEFIKNYVCENYYLIDFTVDEIRPEYEFCETCQMTVPQAIEAFFESTGFEDAIRTAVSLGGDSDTLAAIAGSIAEAYYGVPDDMRAKALTYLDKNLLEIYNRTEFEWQKV